MSFSKWKIKRLDEITKVIDSLHKTPKYIESGYPMIRVKDLEKGYLKFNNPAYVSEDIFKEFNKKHQPKLGDILMSRVGSYGIVTYVNTNRDFCLGQNTVVITEYSLDIDSKFLYYILTSNIISEQIEKLVTGSTQKTISMSSIKSLMISCPKLEEQKAIAKILSDLDEKIEVNNKINKNLEEMAQAIFKQWFVDFEFPNEEGKPYKSSGGEMVESELGMIPKGWKIKNITELVDSISIKHKFDKEKVIFLNTSDILEGKFLNKEYSEISNLPGQAKKSISKDDILYSEIRPKNKRFAYVNFDSEDYVVSTKLMVLRSKNLKYSQVIYYLLTGKEFVEKINILAESRSGTFPQITFSTLKSITLAFPEESRFNLDIFKNILDKFYDLANENEKLEKLRDTLLPKLMSGEIRVPLENSED
ncbi:restriction endonuclease subunit S [Clostridium perfringens]|uniref:restriction endonuclease subunit S n=1 Tax=Clostridium perfringens TaxID=1502 RepID=UPI003BABEB46|nr:restriction endonuclease subunit S [Clostridium perfringens]